MLEWLLSKRGRLELDVACISERGLVRRDNQDNLFIDRRRSVFAVADGMGGAQGGAKASEIVCTRLAEASEGARNFEDLMRKSADAISKANHEIREYAYSAGYRQMGTTLVTLFVDNSGRNGAVLAHVGDSRAYRIRGGTLERLTHDHTIAGELSRRSSCRGLLEELQGRAGPLSHVLTRAVGIEETVLADWRRVDIHPGDIYLLCSDGVYDMLPDKALATVCNAPLASAHDIVTHIAKGVLAAGAEDNYTCIVIKAGERI